ncbi:MAG: NAD(P)H-dependent oxidoreductase subunit E, partial [Treponema sp.]|nr:NAD(P)H-dependent oxidoreductase subunit E [Treponema sp.]
MAQSGKSVFSAELLAFIEEWKEKPGNLIMILHRVQEEQGYISNEAAMEVAERTNIPAARVFGVVSFYHF